MIITKDQIMKQEKNLYLKVLANGPFGSGKTYFSMTFPKYAYAMIEPNGIQTANTNPGLMENMVYMESFVPGEDEDIKATFDRFNAFLKKVKEDAQKGIVETFILDNLSHFTQNRWIYIDKYEPIITKSGAKDNLRMFGTLSRYLYTTILTSVIALPCHVVINVHEMEEMEDVDGTQKRTGNIIAKTLGGFRDDVPGLVNANLFLEEYTNATGRHYRARCLAGRGKTAKNNVGLPEIVENLSYSAIIEAIKQSQTKK